MVIPAEDRIGPLSVGQLQKVAIVLALGHEPELLILDEPAASLDPLARRQFLQMIIDLAEPGRRTVLFSTHITSDLERVADRVADFEVGPHRLAGLARRPEGADARQSGRQLFGDAQCPTIMPPAQRTATLICLWERDRGRGRRGDRTGPNPYAQVALTYIRRPFSSWTARFMSLFFACMFITFSLTVALDTEGFCFPSTDACCSPFLYSSHST